MKNSLQTISEVEIAVVILAAAAVALVLMIGHAVWKDIANQRQQDSQSDEPLKEGICTDPRIVPADPALEIPRKVRRELFLKAQGVLPKGHFPGTHFITARQRSDS